MRGVKLDIPYNSVANSGKMVGFLFDEEISGFEHTVQKAAVNTLTVLGSDASYPDRGDNLTVRLSSGIPYNKADVKHACNFSALSAKVFTNEHMDSSDESIDSYELNVNSGTGSNVSLYASIRGSSGTISTVTSE